MLKPAARRDQGVRTFAIANSDPRQETSDVDRLLAAARRQMRVAIACCILALLLGLAYFLTTVPQYTADVSLLIDYRRARAFEDPREAMLADAMGPSVDSQVEILRSNRIAFAVIDKLQLQNDPEFGASPPGLIARLLSAFPGGEVKQAEDVHQPEQLRLNALRRLQDNLEVRRVQRSLVLEVRYRSRDRQKAALIANSLAEAYLTEQLDSKYDATRRASSWLLDRIAELKQQALTTDSAVQKFKAEHDLISAGGKLVSEQQLGEVNTQLVTARAETAKAEARYARIKAIMDNRQTDAVVTEAIGNHTIDQLRLKFLTAAKREAELAPKLGPTHGAVAALRAEMRQYEKLMFDELGRIAESYKSDLVIAQSREQSLKSSLKGLVGTHASANETAVALRELEREAETYRTLYQSFLQRYQEALQQQSFPITEARIISSALPPPRRAIRGSRSSSLCRCCWGARSGRRLAHCANCATGRSGRRSRFAANWALSPWACCRS